MQTTYGEGAFENVIFLTTESKLHEKMKWKFEQVSCA